MVQHARLIQHVIVDPGGILHTMFSELSDGWPCIFEYTALY